jgi:Protein of unknown function (DUF2934)
MAKRLVRGGWTLMTPGDVDGDTLPYFGNHSLLSVDECDACNQAGSLFEGDLANLLFGERLISMQRPRGGSVKYRHGRSEAFVEATPRKRALFIKPQPSDSSVRVWRTATGCRLRIKVPAYRPSNVVKALARMGFFTLADGMRAELDHIRSWLRGEYDWQTAWLCMFHLQEEGTFERTHLQVYVADDSAPETYPRLQVRFVYGPTLVTTQVPNRQWQVGAKGVPQGGEFLSSPPDTIHRDRWHETELFSPELAELPAPAHHEVELAAYYRYLARGGSGDRALDDWVAAEQDLLWKQMGIEPEERPE